MRGADHGTQLLKVQTRGGARRWTDAAMHNLRAIGGPHIDAARSAGNALLFGPADAEGVRALAHERMLAAGINPKEMRSNGTRMGEVICGLPATSAVDRSAYFGAALVWVQERFGPDAVLSAVVHEDEAHPHLHVLMLPMRGGEWLASRVFGDRAELARMHDDFFRRVGSRFGVLRAPGKMTAKERGANARLVLAELKRIEAPELVGPLWPMVRDCIQRNPGECLELLGLDAHRELRTMAEIFTSKGRGSEQVANCYSTSPLPAGNLLCSVSSFARDPLHESAEVAP